MRQKKIGKEDETEEQIPEETENVQKDVKLGEFKLKESAVLLIKKTNYKGEDRIDFRVWLNSSKYKGPTKQGFVLTMDKIDAFVDAINQIKKKLDEMNEQE